ncbi:putative MFS family arabinose efflux permease [Herbihabitans rhizosphaerae]|uniref:Putative MFS family arabinose efflux permease n=1 Tax=Herbihabitans rhizosphaerae TaxID=1872711 RepID=A0A4Q7L1W7_9PSEU|nr:putative MFS family arabinose efflux permease [Herbihabitans rhizosphaerae]
MTFRAVFAVREFRAMWAAEALSQAGDQLARVALAVLVYGRTESAALTGLTYALTLAPSFLGGVFLSGLADRFPRRTVMVVSDLSRAGLIALVAVPGMPFWTLCVLVGLVSFTQAPFKAAQLALLPDVLPGDAYVVGMGIRTITMQTAQTIGFAGGGLLLTAVGPPTAMLLDALTFVVSAAFVWFGVTSRPAPARPDDAPEADSFGRSAAQGGRLIWRDAGLRTLTVFSWLSALLIVYEGLAAPYTAEIGGGPAAVGLILAADPLGSAIGAFVFTRWVAARRRPRLLGPLMVASCVPLLVCLAKPGLVVSVVVFAVAGALGTAVMIQATASFSRGVPDHRRAQALGLLQSGTATVQGLGPLLAGGAADAVGTAHTVGLVGVVGLLIAVPAALAWRNATAARPDVWVATTGDGK